jgi:hypothetical protein
VAEGWSRHFGALVYIHRKSAQEIVLNSSSQIDHAGIEKRIENTISQFLMIFFHSFANHTAIAIANHTAIAIRKIRPLKNRAGLAKIGPSSKSISHQGTI